MIVAGPEIPEGDNVERPVWGNHPAGIDLRKKHRSKEHNRNEREVQTKHLRLHVNNVPIAKSTNNTPVPGRRLRDAFASGGESSPREPRRHPQGTEWARAIPRGAEKTN